MCRSWSPFGVVLEGTAQGDGFKLCQMGATSFASQFGPYTTGTWAINVNGNGSKLVSGRWQIGILHLIKMDSATRFRTTQGAIVRHKYTLEVQ